MKIPEKSALLLVDVQDSKARIAVYEGEEQQKIIDFYSSLLGLKKKEDR